MAYENQKLVYRIETVLVTMDDEGDYDDASVKEREDFEWTTEAPKVVGLYVAETRNGNHIPVQCKLVNPTLALKLFYGSEIQSVEDFTRWLGPIPLPELEL